MEILANFIREGLGSNTKYFWTGTCPRCGENFKFKIPQEDYGLSSHVPIKRSFRQVRLCTKCLANFSISLDSIISEKFTIEDRQTWLGRNG